MELVHKILSSLSVPHQKVMIYSNPNRPIAKKFARSTRKSFVWELLGPYARAWGSLGLDLLLNTRFNSGVLAIEIEVPRPLSTVENSRGTCRFRWWVPDWYIFSCKLLANWSQFTGSYWIRTQVFNSQTFSRKFTESYRRGTRSSRLICGWFSGDSRPTPEWHVSKNYYC